MTTDQMRDVSRRPGLGVRASCVAALAASVVAACVSVADVSAQETTRRVVGIVAQVNGEVVVTAQRTPLKPGAPLFEDDQVSCAGTASFVVVDAEGQSRTRTGADCARTQLSSLRRLAAGDSSSNGKFAAALDNYAKQLGGRPRAALAGLLIWPVGGVRTLPESAAVLEWRRQSRRATIIVRAEGGNVLWTGDVDGAAGRTTNAALTAALRQHVAAASRQVVVELRFSATQSMSASLTLTGGADRARLEQRLTATTGLPASVAHIFRAEAYRAEAHSREALDEYVQALTLLPDAPFLLEKATILALELGDSRAGDLARRSTPRAAN